MKVLHLVSGNLNGGAFLGALNLHNELNKNNIKSIILNDSDIKNINIKNYHALSENNLIIKFKIKLINFLNNLPKLIYLKKNQETFNNSFLGISLLNQEILYEADIIHIHWVAKTYSNLSFIKNLNKPIVWTFRDMWPFTGGCHYSLECEKYKKSCGSCRVLKSRNPNDISSLNYKIKKKNITDNINLVAISNWLKTQALRSSIFKKKNIQVVYSGVNYKNFFPSKKIENFKKYKIPRNKKIIIFGAQNINAKYKGLDYFIDAVKFLDKKKYFIIFFGSFHDKRLLSKINISYICLDKIESTKKMRSILSLGDVYVFSSIQEAFGKSAAESLLCGTPVVCFEKTAISEIISHKKNGYISKYLSSKNISKGIEWVASKPKSFFKRNCLSIPKEKFDIKYCAKKYIKIYKKILNNS